MCVIGIGTTVLRLSGWISYASGQLISFPIRVHLRFTGLVLKVSGLRLWSCLTVLAPLGLYATRADFELFLVWH